MTHLTGLIRRPQGFRSIDFYLGIPAAVADSTTPQLLSTGDTLHIGDNTVGLVDNKQSIGFAALIPQGPRRLRRYEATYTLRATERWQGAVVLAGLDILVEQAIAADEFQEATFQINPADHAGLQIAEAIGAKPNDPNGFWLRMTLAAEQFEAAQAGKLSHA